MVVTILIYIVAVLLIGKLYEMVLHSAFGRAGEKERQWPVTNLIRYLPRGLRSASVWLFNHKILMLLLSMLSMSRSSIWTRWVCGIVLFTGAWIAIYRLLTDKIAFGDRDAAYRKQLAAAAGLDLPRASTSGTPTSRQIFYLDAYLLAVIVAFAYAGLYATAASSNPISVFKNVGKPPGTAVDFVYFSVVTMATVGYGDIVPDETNSSVQLIRLLVTTEIIAGFLVLTVFFVRLNTDETGDPRNGP